jgi:hypothetical protein
LSHSSTIYESAAAIMKHITSNITCLHIYRPKEHPVQMNISQMENVRMFVGGGQGRTQGGALGARAPPLDKKCLEGSTGLKNYPQGSKFFLLASTPLSKFLGTPLYYILIILFEHHPDLVNVISIIIKSKQFEHVVCLFVFLYHFIDPILFSSFNIDMHCNAKGVCLKKTGV